MKNVYLFQPASPTNFDGTICYWLPYSVGCLWSYARQNSIVAENFNLADLVFKKVPIETLLETMKDPAVAAFSCYIWNFEYNKQAAAAIKKKWPNCIISFGGPQVTKRPYENSFFKLNPYIDTVINGEGEGAFVELLLSIHENRKISKVATFARMANLEYPSPYSSGLFDKIVSDNPDYTWQVTLETNRGCPYSCTFCDWGSLTYAKVLKFSDQRVMDDIAWIGRNPVDYMFIADANFGIFYDRDKKFSLALNQLQQENGRPKAIIAQWAKNAKHRVLEIAKIFFNGANRGFTVSVQSMNDQVLDAIKRKNMDVSDLKEMLIACRENNIPAYTEMILGLPYETYESWKQNHNLLLDAGQHNSFDVWLCQLLENSELNSPEQRELHQIQSIIVPKWVTGVVIDEDEILESETLVCGTKYMPFDDLIKSYMFSYIVITFHFSGWAHIVGRFLRRYKNINYVDFYSYIEQQIINGDSILTEEYNKIKDFITNFLSSGECDMQLKRDGQSAFWTSVRHLLKERTRTLDELFKILNNDYCQLEPSLYDDLKSIQYNYIYKFNRQDPFTISYNHNIYDYVFNDGDTLNLPVDIEFYSSWKFDTEEQLIEKAYFGRRSQVIQKRMKVLPPTLPKSDKS